VQAGIGVDKRQILPLLGRKGFCRATHAGHPIQLYIRASSDGEAKMNVRYRVELSQAVPSELTALLSGAPTQLIGEVRLPIRAEPGQLERYDCEYKRNGTANLFIFLDVHRSLAQGQSHRQPDCGRLRHLRAGAHRRSKAERIRVVLDNLSTHSAGAL
jgi:hypothetical protein